MTRSNRSSRSSRRPRRRPRRNKFDIKKYGSIAGVIIIVGGLLGWTALRPKTAKIDEALCVDGTHTAETVVMADVSNPKWSISQHRAILNRLEEIIDQLRVGERLVVYTTHGDHLASVPRPVFTMCRPPRSAAEASQMGTKIRGSDVYLERLYEDEFLTPTSDALERVFGWSSEDAPDDVSHSPILEQISGVSRKNDFNSAPTRLIIVSDFVQNSDLAQFCVVKGDMPSFATFAERSGYSAIAPGDLSDVHVELMMLLRPGYGPFCTGSDEIWRFFRDYFTTNGASAVERRTLQYRN